MAIRRSSLTCFHQTRAATTLQARRRRSISKGAKLLFQVSTIGKVKLDGKTGKDSLSHPF